MPTRFASNFRFFFRNKIKFFHDVTYRREERELEILKMFIVDFVNFTGEQIILSCITAHQELNYFLIKRKLSMLNG